MKPSCELLKVAAAVAHKVGRAETARELADQVHEGLAEQSADLCLLFASAHFEEEIESIAHRLHEILEAKVFIGTTSEAAICGDREFENRPAVVVWAAHLPGVDLTSFHLSQEDLERFESEQDLRDYLAVSPETDPHFILLGDPFSLNALELIEKLNEAFPGRPALGGLASAGERPEQNRLVFDGHTLRHGLVGAALSGNIAIEPIVSQGCRPIGRHYVITKADRNIVFELGGKTAVSVVNEVLRGCTSHELDLARNGLLVGRVINEYQARFVTGDFLIRNPIGFDRDSEAMAVNDLVRTGQTVQFHVRDGATASDELHSLLRGASDDPAAGVLLFSCNGRGTNLFAKRDHDAHTISMKTGNVPLAGFFCAGEIGPVGGRNFLHGHTASIGIIRAAQADVDE